MKATTVIPVDADLPGPGWLAVDEGFGEDDAAGDAAGLFDCVGPEFPEEDVVDTASSPYFIRPMRTLVHGLGVAFGCDAAARRAHRILSGADFASCLGRAVGADLADQPIDAELLGVDVTPTSHGHRVQFTGGNESGVRPVHLDIVAVRRASAVGVLWFGDTPEPFPAADAEHVIARILLRS